MDFPIELQRDEKTNGLVLKVSSLVIFGGKPIFVPDSQLQRLDFFDITYEHSYSVQQIASELQRKGIFDANAYREIRTKKFYTEKPYKSLQTTTFRSYHIPEQLVSEERKKCIALAQSCTS
jgi:hypothetical protein